MQFTQKEMQITCQIESNNGGNPVRIQEQANDLPEVRTKIRNLLVGINKHSQTVHAPHKYALVITFMNSYKELKHVRIFGNMASGDASEHINRLIAALSTAINRYL